MIDYTVEFKRRGNSKAEWVKCINPNTRGPGTFNFEIMDIRVMGEVFSEHSIEFREALQKAQFWMKLHD